MAYFVKNNAPKVVAGIDMITKFFENIKKTSLNISQTQKNSMMTPS